MAKAVALQTIHVCKEPGVKNDAGKVTKRAVVIAVASGEVFDVEPAALAEYEKAGAARKADRAEVAAAEARGGKAGDQTPAERVRAAAEKAATDAQADLGKAKTDAEKARAQTALDAAKARLAELG